MIFTNQICSAGLSLFPLKRLLSDFLPDFNCCLKQVFILTLPSKVDQGLWMDTQNINMWPDSWVVSVHALYDCCNHQGFLFGSWLPELWMNDSLSSFISYLVMFSLFLKAKGYKYTGATLDHKHSYNLKFTYTPSGYECRNVLTFTLCSFFVALSICNKQLKCFLEQESGTSSVTV